VRAHSGVFRSCTAALASRTALETLGGALIDTIIERANLLLGLLVGLALAAVVVLRAETGQQAPGRASKRQPAYLIVPGLKRSDRSLVFAWAAAPKNG
jgi:hypothetical protein